MLRNPGNDHDAGKAPRAVEQLAFWIKRHSNSVEGVKAFTHTMAVICPLCVTLAATDEPVQDVNGEVVIKILQRPCNGDS
ncbi:hypothetical protein O9993_20375 [Vibrio lentus]|nr:hypothetical protein [Vibrio lentus]